MVQRQCRVRAALCTRTSRNGRSAFSRSRYRCRVECLGGGSSNGSLCCGEAGRAYALLSLSRRLGGDPLWLSRARALGERAAASILANEEQRLSLLRGGSALRFSRRSSRTLRRRRSRFWKMKAGVSGALILAVLAGSCNGPGNTRSARGIPGRHRESFVSPCFPIPKASIRRCIHSSQRR